MSSNDLNINNLNQYKNEILKTEIGALLFNLGKTHIGFWKEKKGIQHFNVDEAIFKSNFGYSLFTAYNKYYKKHNDINELPFEYELRNISSKLKDFICNKKVKLSNNNEIDWKEFFYGNS